MRLASSRPLIKHKSVGAVAGDRLESVAAAPMRVTGAMVLIPAVAPATFKKSRRVSGTLVTPLSSSTLFTFSAMYSSVTHWGGRSGLKLVATTSCCQEWHAAPERPLLLAGDATRRIFIPNSDAMNPEARRRADRACLEGSESRNRLRGGTPTQAVFFSFWFAAVKRRCTCASHSACSRCSPFYLHLAFIRSLAR